MITLLARWLIPDRENTADPAVRRAYGTLCGAVGIALNLLLAAGKFLAGALAGSIAVTADAFNNLSDAGSSLITLLGFRLAGRRADAGHPYGHGRLEYVSGLAVAVVIILMAFELGKSAVEKILAPVVEVICEMERIRRKEYLTEKEAAILFSLSAATLKTQRSRGGGPVYIKIGNRALYSRMELQQFISSRNNSY